MHIGHLVPFMFTQYLQEVLNVQLIIQMTDDEKFLFNENLTLDTHKVTGVMGMLHENIKDIIACGFCPDKTFIFSSTEYMCTSIYKNIIRIQKEIPLTTACNVFGFDGYDNIGKWSLFVSCYIFSLPLIIILFLFR